MRKSLPTPEELRKMLRYEPETGRLFWRNRTPDMFPSGKVATSNQCKSWNKRYGGNETFKSVNLYGYLWGHLSNSNMMAHRVAYAIHHGAWPRSTIDHKNGNRADNRAENLRDVTQAENCRNRKTATNNTSGQTGVHWRKDCSRWQAYIKTPGKIKHLGYFTDKNAAIAARKDGEKTYGYYPSNIGA